MPPDHVDFTSSPRTPTHSQIDINRANTASQKLLSADSSLHISRLRLLSSHHILWEYPASLGLVPPPTVLREMPYKGVGKSTFMLHFKGTLEGEEEEYPVLILNLDRFFRNSLDVLTHQSPFGIWAILVRLTTKPKVHSMLSLPYVHYFLKQPFMDKKRTCGRSTSPPRENKTSAAVIDGFIRICPPVGYVWVCWKITHPFQDCGSECDFVMWLFSVSPHCKQTTP